MDNATILILVGITIIVVIARKWDSFKWIFALALVGLALVTAFQMGLFDKQLEKVPGVEFTEK
jgi:hypothetical protein